MLGKIKLCLWYRKKNIMYNIIYHQAISTLPTCFSINSAMLTASLSGGEKFIINCLVIIISETLLYLWKKVCVLPKHSVCLCVCVSVCHHVCSEMARLSNMVSSEVNTIYKNLKLHNTSPDDPFPFHMDHVDKIKFWPIT